MSLHRVLLASIFLCACTADRPAGPDAAQSLRPEQSGAMSECGGFDYATGRSRGPDDMDLDTYCAAERLFVSYDAESERMSLALRRTQFNCCTQVDREVTIDPDGTYVLDLHEQYLPGQTAICGCECIFDLDVAVEDVAPGQVPLRVQHRWLDETPYTKVEEAVELGPEPVEIVISDSATMWSPCDYDDM